MDKLNFNGAVLQKIEKEDKFNFNCSACGQCCMGRSNDIILYPYDVFRIAKGLGISTEEVISKKHCNIHMGKNSKLPIVTLNNKTLPDERVICTFLKKKEGVYRCQVHAFKPSVCRLYPLGRAVKIDVKENKTELNYYMQEVLCGNNKAEDSWHSIDEWIPERLDTEKALVEFSQLTQTLNEAVNLERLFNSKKLMPKTKDMAINVLVEFLYVRYDTEKDFFEQFKSNLEELKKAFVVMVFMCKTSDSKVQGTNHGTANLTFDSVVKMMEEIKKN
ncbi:MAG: YkgJ family cysteine cluster protein [Synergistaceae bacterium]